MIVIGRGQLAESAAFKPVGKVGCDRQLHLEAEMFIPPGESFMESIAKFKRRGLTPALRHLAGFS